MGKPKIKKDAVAALAKVRKVFPYKMIRDCLDPNDPDIDRDMDLFQIFMAIRVLHKDGSNTAYALCPRLKRIWSAFLHRPLAYHQFCNRALNHIIDYDPKSPATEAARSEYNDNTIRAFQESFNVFYIPDPDIFKLTMRKHVDGLFDRVTVPPAPSPSPSPQPVSDEPITVECHAADGTVFILFNVNQTTTVGNVKEAIREHQGKDAEGLPILLFNDALLNDDKKTLKECGLTKNCAIYLNPAGPLLPDIRLAGE